MEYKEVWKEHKNWLKESINHLSDRESVVTGQELKRVVNKKEGLTVSLQRMEDTERIYNLDAENKIC